MEKIAASRKSLDNFWQLRSEFIRVLVADASFILTVDESV